MKYHRQRYQQRHAKRSNQFKFYVAPPQPPIIRRRVDHPLKYYIAIVRAFFRFLCGTIIVAEMKRRMIRFYAIRFLPIIAITTTTTTTNTLRRTFIRTRSINTHANIRTVQLIIVRTTDTLLSKTQVSLLDYFLSEQYSA